MGFNITINFKQIRKDGLKEGSKQLDNFADRNVKGVKSRTPEDTQELLKSIGKTPQTFTGTKILQQVKTLKEIPYLAPVEYGVQGGTYNYNKPKGSIFLRAVGAGMFRRTYFDLKDKFNTNE